MEEPLEALFELSWVTTEQESAPVHELGITRGIVELVAERAAGARVNVVRLEIGKLSAVMPDAIRFCFDLCAQGTALDGANSKLSRFRGEDAAGNALPSWRWMIFASAVSTARLTSNASAASNSISRKWRRRDVYNLRMLGQGPRQRH